VPVVGEHQRHDDAGVQDDAHEPKPASVSSSSTRVERSVSPLPAHPDDQGAWPAGPTDRVIERAADEVRLGHVLLGGAQSERPVDVLIEVDAGLLHCT
jgi:hypothetical protein